ncbi:MAG: CHRD domain-containing protein, partial [Jiangellaceae bacterium]
MQRRKRTALIAVLSLLFAAVAGSVAAAKPGIMNMTTPLSGDEEVPAVDTNATGVAIIKFDGDELTYKLNVANIEDVLMAHIHMGAAGENGPVVAWLYP